MRRILSLIVIVLSCTAVNCFAQAAAPTAPAPAAAPEEKAVELPEGVVATVNGEPIGEEEWLRTLKRVAGRSVLQFMIRHRVVHQAARQQGIELSEAEVQELFDRKVVEAGGAANLRTYLARVGESLEDFKARLATETLLRRMAEKSVTVSEDELRKFYLEQYGRKAEVQAIVTDSEEKAKAAIARVKSGADFGQVASEVSTDQVTAENHGYIPVPVTEGVFPKPMGGIMMTESLAKEIFALEPGEISAPFPGAGDSWYVFKLARIEPARDVEFEEVKEDVRKFASEYKIQNRAAQILQQLIASAVIKIGI